MKLSFSTLGAPDWTFDEILRNGRDYGFDGVAFRGVRRELDLTKVPEFAPDQRKETVARLHDACLRPEMLLTSTRLVLASEGDRHAGLQSARDHIDLAADLGVPYVRVFGGLLPEGASREQARDWAVAGLRVLGEYGLSRQVMPLLETHDDFANTERLIEVMESVRHPNVGVLWDIHHPFRIGGERVADTWNRICRWVRSVDVKDSKVDPTARLGYRYVPIGKGDVPLAEALALLKPAGYDGTYTFEWEKLWHSDIPDAHMAFPDYVRKMRQLSVLGALRETDLEDDGQGYLRP